eukprot:PLAT2517.1.p1 GENE.PLAT2517.1~~PLAT2517.1.p1  ORF type:complete len:656 (-),score=201.01 PLAT2517.1:16-1983(-)
MDASHLPEDVTGHLEECVRLLAAALDDESAPAASSEARAALQTALRKWPKEVEQTPLHWAASHIDQAAVLRAFMRMCTAEGSGCVDQLNNGGVTCLHLLLHRGVEAQPLVDELLQLAPSAASACCARGELPLWQAVASPDVPLCTVEQLLKAMPEAATLRSPDGSTALHAAVQAGRDADVVDALLRAYPEAASILSPDGDLPLHVALAAECSDAVIARLLEAHSEGASTADLFGNLPLHVALKNDCESKDTLQRLLAAAPDGLLAGDEFDHLPLHIAIARQLPVSVLQVLIESNAACASARDGSGLLPLHWAIKTGASRDLLRAVVEAYPEAVLCDFLFGQLPLQRLIRDGSSRRKLALLVEACPLALTVPDCDGNLPLHAALRAVLPVQDVLWLIECQPIAAKTRAGNGQLALHMLVTGGYSSDDMVEVLPTLLKLAPATIFKKDQSGATALELAEASHQPEAVLKLLLAAWERDDAASVSSLPTAATATAVAGSSSSDGGGVEEKEDEEKEAATHSAASAAISGESEDDGPAGDHTLGRELSKDEPLPAPSELTQFSGFLLKKGAHLLPIWRRRYFVLEGLTMAYYVDERSDVRGTIDLSKLLEVEKAGSVEHSFRIHTTARSWLLQARSEEVSQRWQDALQERLLYNELAAQ